MAVLYAIYHVPCTFYVHSMIMGWLEDSMTDGLLSCACTCCPCRYTPDSGRDLSPLGECCCCCCCCCCICNGCGCPCCSRRLGEFCWWCGGGGGNWLAVVSSMGAGPTECWVISKWGGGTPCCWCCCCCCWCDCCCGAMWLPRGIRRGGDWPPLERCLNPGCTAGCMCCVSCS